MKTNLYRAAVIGGDLRQVYLADILAGQGYSVAVYALEREPEHPGIRRAASLQEALEQADMTAAPMPFLKEGKIWKQGEFPDLTMEQILRYSRERSLFFAGGIPVHFRQQAEARKLICVDYGKDERVAMQNTVATAEGIIAEAIRRSPGNLHKSNCVVLGYGRCGSTLVSCLKKFSCKVTVYARSREASARAGITADRTVDLWELPDCLSKAQYIFNTIPARVLSERMLASVEKDALILDLASAPGGVDFQAAKEMGITAALLPGLPGKYAPRASAGILAEAVSRRIGEMTAQEKKMIRSGGKGYGAER